MTENLRFPAEWEPQSAILLAWPHAGTDWADRLGEVEETYIALVAAITRFQDAWICVADDDIETYAAARLRSARVEVVLPAGSVRLPAAVESEIEAAVVAALDNVSKHAGEDARAWVLLDADDQGIEVVIRDNGVGMPPDRLVRAVEEGRLGASSSIRGRMLDLGGDASWRTPGGGGTTVTLTLPATHVAGSSS